MKKIFTFKILSIVVLFLISNETNAQAFTEITTNLSGVQYSRVAWGDYDNDGDLDILLTGDAGTSISKIYRNDGSGNFTDINASLSGIEYGGVAWGDYDNDGDLDILLAGESNSGDISKIYRNDGGGSFTDISASLTGVHYSNVAWGDYDNDGDLDILLTGRSGTGVISKIYRNDGGGNFTDIKASLRGMFYAGIAWGDYDNDGDLDILLTGTDANWNKYAIVYRNDSNGIFTDINASLEGNYHSSVAWGDYDNDGDLDILMAGMTLNGGFTPITKLYRNDSNNTFTEISTNLRGVSHGSISWGDYDNDGDLDILLTGNEWDGGGGIISKIYRNDGSGNFIDINAALSYVDHSSAVWGDYDNDGDLDILLTGDTGTLISKIYRNNSTIANTSPSTPTNLKAILSGQVVTFSWDLGSDTETPVNGLTYNLYIGSSSGSSDIMSPMSDITSGYHKIAALGNVNHNISWTIDNLQSGTYYWSVQTVDGAFEFSAFALENSFNVGISEINTSNLISVFPNPFSNLTTFKFSNPHFQQHSLTIYNVTGQEIRKIEGVTTNQVKIERKGLSNGLYFYQLRNKDEVVGFGKLVIE